MSVRLAGALETAAALRVPVCLMHILMHMQGVPATMQVAPAYDDVVAEVRGFLLTRGGACLNAGIPMDDLVVDPGFGFGFGKTLEHNLELLAALPRIVELGLPVMAGLSRKGMLGAITGRDVTQRRAASVAAAMIAARHGASILRVHDVAATVDAVAVMRAVDTARATAPRSPQLM
jgi:dihydropteroate synthase